MKAFGGLRAVNDVSLGLEKGEIKGLIGPNGAGKTTLLNIVSGVDPPSAGKVLFAGQDITGKPPHVVCKLGVARTFQLCQLFGGLSLVENVMVGLHPRTQSGILASGLRLSRVRREEEAIRDKALEIISFLGLQDRQRHHPRSLPFGEQRLLELGRALASSPKLLLLDEPASGLNTAETEVLADTLQRIRSLGTSILMVEHDMSLVMGVSDRVAVLSYGNLLMEGTPAEVQRDERVVTAYLGTGSGHA